MTAPHADQLIDGYLARLRVAASDLPPAVRDELVEDMRVHIAEARSREPQETDATILNILDRLGEPDAVVAEAGRRPEVFGSSQPPARPEPYQPGILEIAAIVLLPFFWPVGVILLWISPAWNPRDKIIGTLLPPGGYLSIFYFGLIVAHVGTIRGEGNSCTSSTDFAGNIQTSCTSASALQVIAVVLSVVLVIVLWLLPLITAGYLAIRLRWGRRRQEAVA
jgi:uncharacterized membrane protein